MNAVLNYIINLQNGTFGAGVSQAQSQVAQLDGMVNKLGATIAGALSVHKFLSIAEETTQVKAQFEAYDNTIKFAAGTPAEYAKNTRFLKAVIEDLKLPITETINSFAQWSGAIKGTAMEGELGRKIFLGVSAAATTMHMSGEKVSRTYLALSQMMGKGKVQAEELRGQLGEALPGAFNLAARAMGISTKQLNEMLDKGQVLPEVLLPKLADELLKTFGPGVENAINSIQAAINEQTNAITLQKIALGEQLAPVHLQWLNLQQTGLELLGSSISFYREHGTLINALAVAFISGAAAYYLMIAANKLYIGWQAITYTWGLLQLGLAEANTLGLTGWAAAQHALNIAMAANPIGMVIVAIGALIGFLIYAWNHSERFRAIMRGVWEVLKSVAEIIGRLVVLPIQLALDPKGALDSVKRIKDLAGGLGMDFTGAYDKEISRSQAAGVAKPQESPMQKLTGLVGDKKTSKTGAAGGTSAGKSEATSGNRQVRNITLNFKSAINEVKISSTNIQNLSHTQLKQILTDIVVAAAHDAEVGIANN